MRRYGVLGATALLLISTGVSAQQAPAKPTPGGTDPTIIQLPAQPSGTPTASDTGNIPPTPAAAMPGHCGHFTPTS